MALVIPVAHDFICSWCWIGLFQARQLQREFGVEIEWLAYEIFPEAMAIPRAPDPELTPPNKAKTPTRLELAYAAAGMDKPSAIRPKGMRSHNAHEAMEFAKLGGDPDGLCEALYRALYERGEAINDPIVLGRLAEPFVTDVGEMLKSIEEKRFQDRIIAFDAPAYNSGIYNVPTFYVNGEKFAEQPIGPIRAAVQRARKLAAG